MRGSRGYLPRVPDDGRHLAGQSTPGARSLPEAAGVRRPPGTLRGLAKRGLDIAGALALLLACLPVFVAIPLLIRRDGGPALFVDRRIGRDGRPFGCLKFRTMVPNADAALAEVLRADPARREEWRTHGKLRDDPRITPVGRVLRSTSLDELPQLINVLKGEMSLVGPRPVRQSELAQHYGAAALDYQRVRPGITGPWQVSGRSEIGYAQRVAMDADYARNVSLARDIVILFRTVGAVLRRRGAR